MILRLAACAAIMLGCGYLGILFASGFKARVRQIGEFTAALSQLEFDIDFLNITVRESFEKIAGNSPPGIACIFSYVAERMEEERCVKTEKLWERAIRINRSELFLTDGDVAILADFSKNLGCGSRDNEINNIRAAIMRLKLAEDEARAEASGNVKMYRGLGLLCGIFLVIVLL